jgi:HAD superfamily hydrolase (TIGR01509 family)
MPDTAVLFDLDGTLVDTNYLHALAWRRAFLAAGRNVPTSELHRRVGMGSDLLIADVLGDAAAADLGEKISAARQRFFDELGSEALPFDGARELMAAVRSRGALVVLASSAGQQDLAILLKALDATDVVDEIVSGGDVDDAKPRPDVFLSAMQKVNLGPDQCVALGDTVWDIAAARRSGIGCVCVRSGGSTRQELLDAGALAVYDDAAALLGELDSSPIRPFLRR